MIRKGDPGTSSVSRLLPAFLFLGVVILAVNVAADRRLSSVSNGLMTRMSSTRRESDTTARSRIDPELGKVGWPEANTVLRSIKSLCSMTLQRARPSFVQMVSPNAM